MIVTVDGCGIGTVGGGLLEAGAMSRAVELIQIGESATMPVDLSHDTVDTMDMIGSGQVEVLLDCVAPTPMNRTVFNRWRQMLDDRQKGALLSIVIGSEKTISSIANCLVTTAGEFVGNFPLSDGDRERVSTSAANSSTVQSLACDGAFVVVLPTQRVGTAYLFGAGHVGRATAVMAAMVGLPGKFAQSSKLIAQRYGHRDIRGWCVHPR